MDNRPIGFFDSGLGGLTSLPYLSEQLPHEKIVYFGDTARTPYGSKAVETIRSFSMQIAHFLVDHDVKMIAIACNTVSSTCLADLRIKFPHIPIVGVIEPTADTVASIGAKVGNVGIIATKVTIASGEYTRLIEEKDPKIKTFSKACPAFVPLIEEGIIENDIMDLTIKYYMDQFIAKNKIDTVVLGCTHYPLIEKNIRRIYPVLRIINSSKEIIHSIKKILEDNNMLAKDSPYDNIIYASDLSENFTNMISNIFERPDVKVKLKNLEL